MHVRVSIALVTAVLLVGAAVTPAHAVTTISGTVRSPEGAPVAEVFANIYAQDPVSGAWNQYDGINTGANGVFTLTSPADDGNYAFYFETGDSTATFSSDQGWNGAVDSQRLTAQFSVSGGNPSATTFDQTLLRNAGVVKLTIRDAQTGGALSGDDDSGFGALFLADASTPEDGYLATDTVSEGEYNFAFDGTLEIGHVLAATYFSGYVYGENANSVSYRDEVLDPLTVAVGETTTYPDVTLYPNGTPGIATVLPGGFRPAISGVPKVGTLLTADAPASSAGLSYQWFANDRGILGATAQTYEPKPNDLSDTLTVRVIARQPGYVSRLYTSTASKPVATGDANQVSVTVAGTPLFGGVLKAAVSSALPGATFAYQWYRNGFEIPDATGSAYTVAKADVGERVAVSVRSVVQGHEDSVIPSDAVTIGRDAVSLKATAKSTTTAKEPKVRVTLKAGKSGIAATARVTVKYTVKKKVKSKKVRVRTGKTVSVTLPKLSRGTHTITVVYPGTIDYTPKSVTTKVKITKPVSKKSTKKKK
jgi:hypothetical protein